MNTVSPVSLVLFFSLIATTLVITYWAANRSHTTSELYTAGGRIKAWQNGWAIAGDILSASTLLGGVGMFYTSGIDALLYSFPVMAGFVVMLGLVVGPMRNLGRHTFADAVGSRFSGRSVRIVAATNTLAISLIYLVAQMLGAGGLIQILFGIPYRAAVVVVGALMVTYVAFGGMLATTWVQITKAILLLASVAAIGLLALAHFGFDITGLYARAESLHPLGRTLHQPGGLGLSRLDTVSLCIAMTLGMAGMPHLLMRFFTVPDARTARRSLAVGIGVIGSAYFLVYSIVGPAAVAFIRGNSTFEDASGGVLGGANMVVLHLARYLGGDAVFGMIAAVTFATILAVVSGLTIAAASAISYDLYARGDGVTASGRSVETLVFRLSAGMVGVLSIALGIAFEGQNILFLTGLLFAISASTCFPMLVMAIYWRRVTATGVVSGSLVGLVLSVALIVAGPSVWVQVLGHAEPLVALTQPAVVSVPASFLTMIVMSFASSARRFS